MSAAMASGDVQFAISQGVPPFVVATSAGQDLQIIDVAVSYSDNDNCVVRTDLEITKDNASELAGKRVAVPIGTAAHYGFLKQMAHFGVDVSTLQIVDMAPPDGAAAIAQGAVDMACGFGGGLGRMKEHGDVLLTGAEKEELGILVFDVTTSPAAFLAENPELAAKFVKVTADANAMWNEGSKKAEMIEVIAKDAGMDVETATRDIGTFVFPSIDEQLSAKWLGGGSQEFMKGVAEVFVTAGSIPAALDSYEGVVNTAPLEAAKGM
jgi:taurine transport system substrate-binding protein